MSVYCIGDLHGRYEPFHMMLQKIKFNPNKDKLYLLGDVIDWHFGGIKILDFVMKHQSACTLLVGNHEAFFLNNYDYYDVIMRSSKIKESAALAVDVFSEDLFEPILSVFTRTLGKKSADAFYSQTTIKNWLKRGNPKVRKRLLDAMILLVDSLAYNREDFKSVYWVLANLHGQFKTKAFVQELLLQSDDQYVKIKSFLKNIPHRVEFNYLGKRFALMHSKGSINPNVPRFIYNPHANTKNVTYIFGHDPVPLLHKAIYGNTNSFTFNYRNIFSWIDTNMNRYYWMDLASNPIAALRLDDMSEYYVGLPSTSKNASQWEVPSNICPTPGRSYQYVDFAKLGENSFRNTAIITTDNGCYEFLIGVVESSKTIYYTHIGWLEIQHSFSIENWYDKQSWDEIIEVVRADFAIQSKNTDNLKFHNSLHGILPSRT